MRNLIDGMIANASWARAIGSIVLLFVFSLWLFRAGGDFAFLQSITNALPETRPNIPADHTEALAALRNADALGIYQRFQFFDFVFATLNFAAISSIIALTIKRFGISTSPYRFVLGAPVFMFASDIIEDILLLLVINGNAIATDVQPTFTFLKFMSAGPSIVVAVLCFVALVVYMIGKLRASQRDN